MSRISTKYPGVRQETKTSKKFQREDTTFYIQYRDQSGKERFEKVGSLATGMTAAKANQLRIDKMTGRLEPNSVKRARLAQEKLAEDSRWTLERLWHLYQDSGRAERSRATDQSIFRKHLQKEWGDKLPAELTPWDFDRLRVKMLKTHSPQTVRHILGLIQRLINNGVRKAVCAKLPFQIEMPKVDNIKTEDLTPDQLARLWQHLETEPNRQAANFVKMILLTGMRRGELFRLQWEHLDFHNGFIWIDKPKGGKSEKIPMNQPCKALLQAHERPFPQTPFVFPGKDGQQRTEIKKPMQRIKQTLGLPADFRPNHGLRHVFASMLASSGQVDLYTIQKLLTHKDQRMTQRYAHLRDDALKRGSAVAGEILTQAVGSL